MDYTKPIIKEDGFPTIPTVVFTDDEWKTVYVGKCIDKTHNSYLIESDTYGTYWISKRSVRLKNSYE